MNDSIWQEIEKLGVKPISGGADGVPGAGQGAGSPAAAGAGAGVGAGAGAGAGAGDGAGPGAGAGEGQGQGVTWDTLKGQIPKELAGEKVWESVKDFPSLAKQFVDSHKMVGGSVRVPKEGAPQEEWDKFYAKLGRPESADGYQFPLPQVDHGQWNEKIVGDFKKAAHGLGLTPRQAQGLMHMYADMERQAVKERGANTQTRISELKTEWGEAFKNNLAIAKSATRQLFGQKFIDMLNRTGLGDDPDLIRGMVRVGRDMMEDGTIEVGESFSSLASVQTEINAVMNLDKEGREKHPYWNDKLAGHKEAVDKMFRLREVIANTGQA